MTCSRKDTKPIIACLFCEENRASGSSIKFSVKADTSSTPPAAHSHIVWYTCKTPQNPNTTNIVTRTATVCLTCCRLAARLAPKHILFAKNNRLKGCSIAHDHPLLICKCSQGIALAHPKSCRQFSACCDSPHAHIATSHKLRKGRESNL